MLGSVVSLRWVLISLNFAQPVHVPNTDAIGCPWSCSIPAPRRLSKVVCEANRSPPEEPPRPCTWILVVRFSLSSREVVTISEVNE
ncbi:uncharacterized protein BDZ83DRAFT_440849 [Colletotrichum acutatum]|uniref:Secreted protein n=1 Tax=Glomerella acutata TaxID=27357 RepID=A0AAD8XD72_GLOAC|nr:uncharacterized protein BDZ83DRAFT_440849 [Colletotrichum acutatum]KAK1721195.1 hypothetical protein BDZ83DRAFT_440849 [Colletotrichum acutatum]